MSDEWIRASELSEYVYCRRSWYLRQVRGYASTNIRQMQAGTQFHQQHGQQVQKSVWLPCPYLRWVESLLDSQ